MNLSNVAGIDVSVDDETLARAARDEWAGFEILYRRYVTPVYRYCYARTDDGLAAEDLTAQTLGGVLAGAHPLSGRKLSDAALSLCRNRRSPLRGAGHVEPGGITGLHV